MMCLKWAEKKIQKLNVWEFGLVKLILVIFGIVIGAYIATFVKQYLWYFVATFVVGYILIMYRIFSKK